MTRIYLVYTRRSGEQPRSAVCECDTLDPVKAGQVARDARRRGLIAEIKAWDVPSEELA